MGMNGNYRQREWGATFVELIISIVIVSIAVAGIMLVIARTSGRSANPMIEHQAMAIAEAYLEEILALPYDEEAASGSPEGALGPDAGETGRLTYDDVNDYHGHSDAGARSFQSPATVITGLDAYTIAVTVANDANLGPAGIKVPSADAQLVQVRVTHPQAVDITLSGFRTRY